MSLEEALTIFCLVITWGLVFLFGLVLLSRRPQLIALPQRSLWLFWGCFVCFAVVLLLYYPAWRGMATIARAPIVVIAYVMKAHVCCDLMPALRPRSRWLIGGAVLALAGHHALWEFLRLTGSGPWVAEMPALATNLFVVYIILFFVLPTYNWTRHSPHQRPVQLRFLALSCFHTIIAIWLASGIIQSAVEVVGWAGFALDLQVVFVIFGLICVITFPAHFLPDGFFVRLVVLGNSLLEWGRLFLIHDLEVATMRLAEREAPAKVDWQEWRYAPEAAIYSSVIAIIDQHKTIRARPEPLARWLATQLEQMVQADLDYPAVVDRLCKVALSRRGWRYV